MLMEAKNCLHLVLREAVGIQKPGACLVEVQLLPLQLLGAEACPKVLVVHTSRDRADVEVKVGLLCQASRWLLLLLLLLSLSCL